MLHIIIFLRPLRYLNPGTGSVLIQLVIAALGGGMFFFIKSKWNAWFGKGKKTSKSSDDIEENVEEGNAASLKAASKSKPVVKESSKTPAKAKTNRPASTSKKTTTKKTIKRG
jgi:hypothetical protein